MRTETPVYRPDPYSASAIRDPYRPYAALRALGPVVRLRKHKVHALPRCAECRQVLPDAVPSSRAASLPGRCAR
ncbi:hypothetical protein [Streptomyces sp. MAI_2237]